jgi:peroxiredoxin
MSQPVWPYPAPADDGGARHLAPGLALPDLPLPSTHGAPVNLRCGAGRAIVFVYPWAGRPGVPNPPGWDEIPGAHGSTPQAAGFRDLHAEFEARGVGVFGLSGQSQSDQREFSARLGLPFPLLSDEGRRFAEALRLPRFAAGGKVYLARLTLIVCEARIAAAIYPVHPPDRHAAEVLARLRQQVV